MLLRVNAQKIKFNLISKVFISLCSLLMRSSKHVTVKTKNTFAYTHTHTRKFFSFKPTPPTANFSFLYIRIKSHTEREVKFKGRILKRERTSVALLLEPWGEIKHFKTLCKVNEADLCPLDVRLMLMGQLFETKLNLSCVPAKLLISIQAHTNAVFLGGFDLSHVMTANFYTNDFDSNNNRSAIISQYQET